MVMVSGGGGGVSQLYVTMTTISCPVCCWNAFLLGTHMDASDANVSSSYYVSFEDVGEVKQASSLYM